MTKQYAIGVDVGGSHISCKTYDLASKELVENSLYHRAINNQGSVNEIFSTFELLLKPAIKAISAEELTGVGLAFPGPIDYYNGIGLFDGENTKYQALCKVNIRTELSERLDIDADKIRFINDATAFAIGEYYNGHLQGAAQSLAITLGTGFGAAFLNENIPVLSGETVPAGGVLWNQTFKDGIADDYFSTRGLIARYKSLTGIEVKGVKDIADRFSAESAAKDVFTDFGVQLSTLIMPWLKSFGGDKLVIGGNISKAFSLFEEPLNQALQNAGLSTEVAPSVLLEDGAFIGAASLLDDRFFNAIQKQLKLM